MAIKFFDIEKDTHAEFVKRYEDGDLILSVQTNAAGYLFKDILAEYASRQSTFRMMLFGGFIVILSLLTYLIVMRRQK